MRSGDNFFWIDAFSGEAFGGNPAAVCLVEDWPEADVMQSFAGEVQLSETAFIRREGDRYEIRWFTPTTELGLVGHATLAAAYAVLCLLEPSRDSVVFRGREGDIETRKEGGLISIVLPADTLRPCEPPDDLCAGLGVTPAETYRGRHYVAMLPSARDVENLVPDFHRLARLDLPTIAVTAPGEEHDYVLRFFAPANGVPEDPVSGVAQCSLAPLWSARLDKTDLVSRQLSNRRATMHCTIGGDKVSISGDCSLIIKGCHLL